MKKKIGIAIGLLAVVIAALFLLFRNPIVSCNIEIPENYMDAARSQAKGLYSERLPLVPIVVRINSYSEDVLYYTIYYFPLGTVGMSYSGGDGYNIEKPLINM